LSLGKKTIPQGAPGRVIIEMLLQPEERGGSEALKIKGEKKRRRGGDSSTEIPVQRRMKKRPSGGETKRKREVSRFLAGGKQITGDDYEEKKAN